MKFNQMDLISVVAKEIDRQQTEAHDTPISGSRAFNAIIAGVNSIIAELERPNRDSFTAMGLTAWLRSDDTGMSSKAMAHHLCGSYAEYPNEHPHDPDDFGRCHRFLEAVPTTRERVSEMEKVSPKWKALADHWDELTAIYLEEIPTGKCPKLYARMKELLS